ncbi:MAG: molybdopterin-guanine dinucleotide biosynthesis protein MobB [Spirochaetales bacterium]|nr:molybdopterin-guanine dinucleotide biosynthesis protein MobB [Spirochaetales bacterium]
MRAIGIIGYHNSGKTYVGTKIAAELTKRGYSVSAIKHIHGSMKHADNDTSHYISHCSNIIGISGDQVLTIENKVMTLQENLLSITTDFVIIEGFKEAATFPKIICDVPEQGSPDHDLKIAHINAREITDEKIADLCDLIEEKAFFFAGTNCKKCGYSSCLEFGKAIITGKTLENHCASLPKDIHLRINGEEFPLHSFVSSTLKGTIIGFIKNLKGYKEGKVTIEIP